MTPADSSQYSHDDALGLLTEEIEELLAAGHPVDTLALAQRYGLAEEEVERVSAALQAIAPSFGEPQSLPLPQLPDDYEIGEEIGRGGMGVVYRVHQRSLDRDVAIKVLRPGELLFGPSLERFRREARSLARLRHPHVVAIHEVGEAEGLVYFAMDLIEGGSLAQHLREEGVPTATWTVRMLRQVTSAIAYVHGVGLIHRDLKPANILIDEEGQAYVVDFGLARDAAANASLTSTGNLLGTPDYMSPEQARGDAERIGEASDIYALGAILYECLTGRAPFTGMPLIEKIHAVVYDEPPLPRKLAPRVPRELEVVCLKAMAKEPEQRYATARALLEDLERFADGRGIRATEPSLFYRMRRGARRHRSALSSAASVLLLAAVAFWIFVLPRLGATVDEKLADASALLDADEFGAARVLFERGLELSGDTALEDPGKMELVRGLLHARVELGRAKLRAGEAAEATRIGQEALRDAEGLSQVWYAAKDWDDAQSCAELEQDLATAAFLAGEVAQGVEHLEAMVRRDEDLLFMTLEPLLIREPQPDLAPLSAFPFMAYAPLEQGGLARQFAAMGDAAPAACIGLMRAMPAILSEQWQLQSSVIFLEGLAHGPFLLRHGEALQRSLHALASDATVAGGVRMLALDLLISIADLPPGLWSAQADMRLPKLNEEFIGEACALWERTRNHPAAQALEERIAFALAPERPVVDQPLLDAWMRARTGHYPESHEKLDVRTTLEDVLDIGGMDTRGILAELLSESEGIRRAQLHTLLRLRSQELKQVAAWPFVGGELLENSGWYEALCAALGFGAEDSLGAIHCAFVLLHDFDAPVLLWEASASVNFSNPIEMSTQGALEHRPFNGPLSDPLGLSESIFTAEDGSRWSAWLEGHVGRFANDWAFFVDESGTSFGKNNGGMRSHADFGNRMFPPGLAGVFEVHEVLSSENVARRERWICLTLVCLEPNTSDGSLSNPGEEWGIAGWQARMSAALSADATALLAGIEADEHLYRRHAEGRLSRQVWAALVPDADLAPELALLTELYGGDDWSVCAELAVGAAGILATEWPSQRAEQEFGNMLSATSVSGFWPRLAVATDVPKILERSIEVMACHEREFSLAEWERVEARAAELLGPLPQGALNRKALVKAFDHDFPQRKRRMQFLFLLTVTVIMIIGHRQRPKYIAGWRNDAEAGTLFMFGVASFLISGTLGAQWSHTVGYLGAGLFCTALAYLTPRVPRILRLSGFAALLLFAILQILQVLELLHPVISFVERVLLACGVFVIYAEMRAARMEHMGTRLRPITLWTERICLTFFCLNALACLLLDFHTYLAGPLDRGNAASWLAFWPVVDEEIRMRFAGLTYLIGLIWFMRTAKHLRQIAREKTWPRSRGARRSARLRNA